MGGRYKIKGKDNSAQEGENCSFGRMAENLSIRVSLRACEAQRAGLHPQVLSQQAWGGNQETESLTSSQVILWLPVRDPLSEKHCSMKRALHTEFQTGVEMEFPVLKRWKGSGSSTEVHFVR